MDETSEIFVRYLERKLAGHGAIADFCRKTGFSRAGVDRWIKRERTPGIDALTRAAKYFGEQPWEIIHTETSQKEPKVAHPIELLEQALTALRNSPPILNVSSIPLSEDHKKLLAAIPHMNKTQAKDARLLLDNLFNLDGLTKKAEVAAKSSSNKKSKTSA